MAAQAFKRRYVVLIERGLERKVQKKTFGTYDEALAYAETLSPELVGDVMPNVSQEAIDKASRGLEYERGVFWMRDNRYAVILSNAYLDPASA